MNAKNYEKPTVSEVFEMMNLAASNYKLDKWEDVHRLIDVSDRTFRRWKKNVDKAPDTVSPIGFQGYALLYALAYKKPCVDTVEGVNVPERLCMSADEFKEAGISKDEVKTIVGLKSASGLSIKAIAPMIGLAPNPLANQINSYKDEKISFATWAMILMVCGVPISKIFK